jgi:hypothetical protein
MLIGCIFQMVSWLLGTAANALMDQVIPAFFRGWLPCFCRHSPSLIWLNDVGTTRGWLLAFLGIGLSVLL